MKKIVAKVKLKPVASYDQRSTYVTAAKGGAKPRCLVRKVSEQIPVVSIPVVCLVDSESRLTKSGEYIRARNQVDDSVAIDGYLNQRNGVFCLPANDLAKYDGDEDRLINFVFIDPDGSCDMDPYISDLMRRIDDARDMTAQEDDGDDSDRLQPPPASFDFSLPFDADTWDDEIPNLTELSVSSPVEVYSEPIVQCRKCHDMYLDDTIIDRTALVMTKQGEPVEVVLQFCMGCSQYFIEKDVLEAYQRIFGELDIRVK